jgi:hypothetical protein
MKHLRLILTFYKSFAIASFVLTFICLGLMYGFGKNGIHMIQAFFWFKIITLGIIVYYTNSYKKNQFYYYKNLGISKMKLWLPILVFDFLFFMISIIILAIIIHDTLPRS